MMSLGLYTSSEELRRTTYETLMRVGDQSKAMFLLHTQA